MSVRIIPAIMSGGAGTRLWPLSTEERPKQFHALCGLERSLFAETAARLSGRHGGVTFAPPLVVCNERHLHLVREHLAISKVDPEAIVLEPLARNTAPVAAVAAALAAERDPGALVLLAPADHLIGDVAAFHAAIERAAPVARDWIVTFGIEPDRPATGYGYIKRGAHLDENVFAVERFVEKPDEATARAYLAEGGYSWNAGIFLFSPAVLMKEFDGRPEIRDGALAALSSAHWRGKEVRLDEKHFRDIPSEPFDTAIMEKTKRAAVVPCRMGWTDIGAWDEVWRSSDLDDDANARTGDVVSVHAQGNLLRADGVKLCVWGVNNLIVIATPDAVLVLPRDNAQEVKTLRGLGSGREVTTKARVTRSIKP